MTRFAFSYGAACCASALLLLAPLSSFAQEPTETPPSAGSAIREVSPGVYEIGQLRLEKEARSVAFKGAVNMTSGPLEYLLVTPQGSTHESLLVTSIEPADLHMAMLLLGATDEAKGAQPATGQINAEYLKHAPKLTGHPVEITVTWKAQDGSEKTTPVEDWLSRTDTKAPVPRGPWLYTGSQFGADGKFLAQNEGCFAALVTYPAALINNPRAGNDNDQIWAVNEKAVPPVKTPVEIVIRLEERAGKAEAKP